MKQILIRAVLFFVFSLVCGFVLYAQSSDSIYVKRTLIRSYRFCKDGEKIPRKQIALMAKNNKEAKVALRRWRETKLLAFFTIEVSGSAMGIGLGNVINGSTNDLKYILLGSGLIGYVNLIYLDNRLKPMYMQQIADALNKGSKLLKQ